MDGEPICERTRLRREPERGVHDPGAIHAVIDAATICHLGLTDQDGLPLVIPTIHARIGDQLYVHGSAASRTLRRLAEGIEVCCTITLVDGIVLARSSFWSSMNYRSVMIFGKARLVIEPDEIEAALDAIVEHIAPGRTDELRRPTDLEVRATKVIALPITEASAKIRTGDPNDDPGDLASDVWAGVVPIEYRVGTPIVAANLAAGIPTPPSVARLLQSEQLPD